MRILLLPVITLTASFAASGVVAQECGNVIIAEMNWASSEMMANVDKLILESGYGCNVELILGATSSTFASMNEKGTPDIAPELWINELGEPLRIAQAEGRLVTANAGPITGLGEGWWISPVTLAKYPELQTVMDVIERPDLFPSAEDPSKGGIVGCPAGWGCQNINVNLFEAFDMAEKGWVLIDPGSAAGLDGSISKANERGDNWFGYYWAPTAMVGRYDLQLLPFGVEFAGFDNWNTCIAVENCVDPLPTAWSESEVNTVVTKSFMETGGPAIDYIGKRVFPGDVMNSMLVYMADNQAAGEDAAIEFLQKYEDIWSAWVSEEAAARIKADL
ncbi:MAG: glycine betaine ABC transporter substrate-binding protein [Halocynthiibacter sp.]